MKPANCSSQKRTHSFAILLPTTDSQGGRCTSCCWSVTSSNFDVLIEQKRGVDDKDLLPYFPYRDDGEQILEVIEHMVKDYVDL